MSVIRFQNVSKNYQNQTHAVRDVSFEIEQGEFTALSGPSGSGKTTLLNLAAGFDSVSSGKIEILGHDLAKLNSESLATMRKKLIGFIFQSYNLFPILNAIENVEYPLALMGVDPVTRHQEALLALKAVGMDAFADRKITELSGGQQQRVAIARAVVTRPKIIFADEPTANLDSQSARSLLVLFKKLNEELGITFLFSSHDPVVLQLATRVIPVLDGRVTDARPLKSGKRIVLVSLNENVSAEDSVPTMSGFAYG